MWMLFEQGPSYPPIEVSGQSYPDLGSAGVWYLPTDLCLSKVVEKKEENVVFNRVCAALSINPNLNH
jgi:hypothetical protein